MIEFEFEDAEVVVSPELVWGPLWSEGEAVRVFGLVGVLGEEEGVWFVCLRMGRTGLAELELGAGYEQ